MKKVIMVTGGAGGIGEAVCEKFAQELKSNSTIILHYHSSADNAKRIEARLKKQYGSTVDLIKCDLTDESAVENMARALLAKYKKIDVLVNNAGFVADKELKDRTWGDFEKTFRVNLFAPFLLSKILGQEMFKSKGGHIVNVSSISGMDAFIPSSIDYDASKAALNAVTRDLATAFAPHVNVNAIAPGWVDTPMNKEFTEAEKKELADTNLKKRFAAPSEMAGLIYFLTTEAANFINGSIIPIDGGLNRYF